MFNDSKTIFITHPYYAVNNPDNNLRIYHKAKNSNKWTFIQCTTKEEYRQKIKQYIIGFFDYSRNEEKTVQNFQNVFGFEYDSYYFTNKSIIEEIARIIKVELINE